MESWLIRQEINLSYMWNVPVGYYVKPHYLASQKPYEVPGTS